MSWLTVRSIVTYCVYFCVWTRNLNKQLPFLSVWLQHHRKKVTFILLTDTPISVSVFLQLLVSAVVSVVWAFYRAHFRISCRCPRPTYLNRNNWMCDSTLFHLNCREVLPSDNRTLFDVLRSFCWTRSLWKH